MYLHCTKAVAGIAVRAVDIVVEDFDEWEEGIVAKQSGRQEMLVEAKRVFEDNTAVVAAHLKEAEGEEEVEQADQPSSSQPAVVALLVADDGDAVDCKASYLDLNMVE
jgi:hypothetical protein